MGSNPTLSAIFQHFSLIRIYVRIIPAVAVPSVTMKKFLGIVFLGLFLITPSQADDIRDFEIEGMSIGDSLLDYFDLADMNNFYPVHYPSSDDYKGYEIPKSLSKIKFSEYDSITVNWKKKDKKMKIAAISGVKLYPNNLEACLKERDKTSEQIQKILNNEKETQYKMNYGEGNDSIGYVIDLLIEGGSIRIWCTDWDEKTEKEKNWEDDFNVSIDTKEFIYWLNNIAFK